MKKKIALLSISILLTVISLFLINIQGFGWVATTLWLIALLSFLASITDRLTVPKVDKTTTLSFIGLLVLYAGLRLPYLTAIPFFVNGDEAHIGLEARKILNGTTPHLFTPGWYNFPQLTFFLAAVPMAIFGNNLLGLRMASVIMGLFSIIFTYALTNLLFGRRIAIIASFILVISHLHIHFSRSGTHYMQGVTATVATLYFFVRGIKQDHLASLALAGIGTGLGLQVYLSARLTIFLLLLFTFLFFLSSHKRSSMLSLRQMAIFLLGLLLSIAPVILMWKQYPHAFLSRTNDVFILSQKARLANEYHTDDWLTIMAKQTMKITTFFTHGGDRSSQYGYNGPAIDPLTLALFLAGTTILLTQGFSFFSSPTKKEAQQRPLYYPSIIFLLLWLLATVTIGGMFTIDAPFSPRLLPVTAPIAIISACGISWLTNKLGRNIFIKNLTVISLLLAITLWNGKMYFIDFTRQDIDYNSYRYTYLAKSLSPLAKEYFFILITDPSYFLLDHGTIHFLDPQIQGATYNHLPSKLVNNRPNIKTMVIFTPDKRVELERLKKIYPSAEEIVLTGRKDELLFTLVPLPKKS